MFGFGRRKAGAGIRRILIVEDEPLIAFDNEHFLNDAGFEVVATVDTAAEAERLLAAGGIDLVTADVKLHEGSGVDVARAAHAGGVPVLFVTGNCPAEAAGFAVGCLAKPYSQRVLLDAIRVVAAVASGEKPPRRLPSGMTLFAR
ncbi:response regulator [Sphingomonas sp.]|uniref:response regulator n=1 Tax=Sphingomonas sp. TaxID=28214 RepID=UPI003AFFA046